MVIQRAGRRPRSGRIVLTRRQAETGVTGNRRYFLHRCLVLVMLAAVLLQPAILAGAVVQADTTFLIGENVSGDDEWYVREGIQFASDYLLETVKLTVERQLLVNILAVDSPAHESAVAMAGVGWIGVYTGSESWRRAAPFTRLRVVVHEIVHVAQAEAASEATFEGPSWITEGIAEYLSYDALVSQGLIDAEEVRDENWYIADETFGADLAEAIAGLEDDDDFYNHGHPAYALAELAVSSLVARSGLSSIAIFYQELRTGSRWERAFALAFGMRISQFYDAFAGELRQSSPPAERPAAFAPAYAVARSAPLELLSTPEAFAPGEQIVILGQTHPFTICGATMADVAGPSLGEFGTFADALGRVFWLWTPATDLEASRVRIDIACGGPAVTLELSR